MRGREGYERGWNGLEIDLNDNGKGSLIGFLKEGDVRDGWMDRWM